MVYKDQKTCGANQNVDDCKKNALKGIVLACGQGSSVEFMFQDEPQTQIASVSIDLSHLLKPKVLIEFSSIISYAAGGVGAETQLRYELFRVCDNEEPVLLGNWLFERVDTSDEMDVSIDNISFNFNFCDFVKCPGCCQYFVTIRPLLFNIPNFPIRIDNTRMSAIAQSSID